MNDISGVYLLLNEFGISKIGVTKDMNLRLSQIVGASGCDVEVIHFSPDVVDAYKVESELHAIFEHKRKKREWFNLTEEDRLFVIQYISDRARKQSRVPKNGIGYGTSACVVEPPKIDVDNILRDLKKELSCFKKSKYKGY